MFFSLKKLCMYVCVCVCVYVMLHQVSLTSLYLTVSCQCHFKVKCICSHHTFNATVITGQMYIFQARYLIYRYQVPVGHQLKPSLFRHDEPKSTSLQSQLTVQGLPCNLKDQCSLIRPMAPLSSMFWSSFRPLLLLSAAGLFTWPRVTDSQPHVWLAESRRLSTHLTEDFITLCYACVCMCLRACGDNPWPKHQARASFQCLQPA